MVRRIATEPNTACAGGILPQESFARFRKSMATFSEERRFSRPFCCWELFVSMVEGRGSCESRVWRTGCAEGREPEYG